MKTARISRSTIAAVLATMALATAACGSDAESTTADDPAAAPLELSLGAGEAMAMCLPFEVETLKTMSPAFAATATEVEGESVILEIDHWYTGGDAATATVSAESGMEALIGGFEFEVGEQYLITASGSNVNFCGYSGIATPDMTAAFEEAFEG